MQSINIVIKPESLEYKVLILLWMLRSIMPCYSTTWELIRKSVAHNREMHLVTHYLFKESKWKQPISQRDIFSIE